MNFRYYRIISTTLVMTAILASTPLIAQQSGEEWEYQGNMEMMGMKMPIPSTKRCQNPEEVNNVPPVESNCKISDVQTEGDTTSFRMLCGPPDPMEGSGTTTRTEDKVDMKYTLKSPEGEMAFAMTGKKLGACTP